MIMMKPKQILYVMWGGIRLNGQSNKKRGWIECMTGYNARRCDI